MTDDATLDLSGKPPKAEQAAKAPRQRAARPSGAQQRKQASTKLNTRIEDALDRIGQSLERRGAPSETGDTLEQLGTAIREDKEMMAGGLVNLTRHVKPLRPFLLLGLEALEPLLAFGRVLKIIVNIGQRARREALELAHEYEHDQEQAENGTSEYPAPELALG